MLVTHDVEEAVFLSDRVVVMDARPGRIRSTFDIEVPHPRERLDPRLRAYADAILASFDWSVMPGTE